MNRTAEGQSDSKNYQWFRNIYSCIMVRCYQKLLYFLSFVSLLMNFPDQILVAFSEVLIIQDHPWRSLEDNQHGRVCDFASKEGRSRTRVSFSCSAGRILFFMLSVWISRYAMAGIHAESLERTRNASFLESPYRRCPKIHYTFGRLRYSCILNRFQFNTINRE